MKAIFGLYFYFFYGQFSFFTVTFLAHLFRLFTPTFIFCSGSFFVISRVIVTQLSPYDSYVTQLHFFSEFETSPPPFTFFRSLKPPPTFFRSLNPRPPPIKFTFCTEFKCLTIDPKSFHIRMTYFLGPRLSGGPGPL